MQTVLEPTVQSTTRLLPRYRILIHNDDTTPADFVTWILCSIFDKVLDEAIMIMVLAHETGIALVEVTELERAEFLVEQTHSLARTRKYPLTLTYEPED